MVIEKFSKAVRNPRIAARYLYTKAVSPQLPELYRNDMNALKFTRLLALQMNSGMQRRMSSISQTDVMAQDWDNLILLDGCRVDIYKETIQSRDDFGTDNLNSIFSVGSASPEFLSRTFDGETFHDTVYISANPFTEEVADGTFHTSHALIRDERYWSEQAKTVPPKKITTAVKELASQYPNKRLIIHYMQPHHPFLGSSGADVPFNRGVYGSEHDMQFSMDPWDAAYRSLRPNHELLRQAYRENLELALDAVQELVAYLCGKIAISADHANLIGDRGRPIPVRGYGHPPEIHSKPLLEVPWHTLPFSERKNIQADAPIETERFDDDLDGRLAALGYK